MKQLICFAVILATVSCAQKKDPNLNSVLWVQTAAEYQANCRLVYNAALKNIDLAIDDNRWTGALEQKNDYEDLPPAVIFDLDETVFDNSEYQAQLVIDGSDFTLSSWDQWIRRRQADGIPGAVEFINLIQDRGVEVIFITNRECIKRNNSNFGCPQESDTIQNLRALGISGITRNNVLLKNEFNDWGSEKKNRREFIAEKYRILMIFGDDLGDFIPGVKTDISPEKRSEMAEIHHTNWGTRWFIIPNPMYGSWHRILKSPATQYLHGFSSDKN